jgi:1,3-beta-glucan synthase
MTGKPAHQNFLTQFVDGSVIQAIDINQASVLSQSFFIPNVLSEFQDESVKIVGCPEFIITDAWSATAWCSAFSERTFGTILHRVYSRLGIRLHYGHPDFFDAFFVMV